MRLIDADELSKWISWQSKSPSCPKNESAFGLRIIKHIDRMPSAQPEPSQVARDIATIIENEQDMRVIERNDIVRCKDCKHNPKDEWFGCPMSHLSEKQRPETAWCWKGERRTE